MEELIKKHNLESDKYPLEAEQNKNLELLKLSNGLKRAAKETQPELGNIHEEEKCLQEKKKNIV